MDDMTAKNFMMGRKRMCNYYKNCTGCPLKQNEMLCGDFMYKHTEETIAIVQKWCAKHPVKTLLEKFFEVFPDAPKDEEGIPIGFCPDDIGYKNTEEPKNYGCAGDCKKCWSQPYVETKE